MLGAVFRVAQQAQEDPPERPEEQLSYVERAGRIAAAYWDDPAKWAAQQGGKFGRGILACARATDPFYPLDKNAKAIYTAIAQHQQDLQERCIGRTVVSPPRKLA